MIKNSNYFCKKGMTLKENYIRIVKVSGYINDAIFNLSKKG